MTPTMLLDTNVILRHILQDPEEQALQASALFLRIRSRELAVRISDTIIFETVYTLQRFYKVPRPEIRQAILSSRDWSGIILLNKSPQHEALDRWVAEPSLSFADSYHLSLAKSLGLTGIISFDRKIAQDPAVIRIEP